MCTYLPRQIIDKHPEYNTHQRVSSGIIALSISCTKDTLNVLNEPTERLIERLLNGDKVNFFERVERSERVKEYHEQCGRWWGQSFKMNDIQALTVNRFANRFVYILLKAVYGE